MVNSRYMRGVTLLELMIVVVIVSILASIAVGSYRSYLLRTNRTEARVALLRIQVAQEKFFLQNGVYADNSKLATAPPGGLGVEAATPSGQYAISIDNFDAAKGTYRAVATATGGQTKDASTCQVLTIDQTGARTPSQSSGCWR